LISFVSQPGTRTLLSATLFGVYFAARYNLKEQLQLLAWVLGIAALLSLVLALALPSWGIMGMSNINTGNAIAHLGAWRGIYINRNILGSIMVLSSVVFLLVATSSSRYRWISWAGFSLSICLILLSHSKASLVMLLTLMLLLPLYRALQWNYNSGVAIFIAVISVSAGLAKLLRINAEMMVGALGKDLTFTGRTAIWSAVLEKIWERPLLGYGCSGFWNGWKSDAADVWRILGYEAPHAHNGFLELWLELGLLGLIVFTLSFIAVWLQALTWARQARTTEGLWPLVYLTFLLLANLAESALLEQGGFWMLYVAITLSMHNSRLCCKNSLKH
jgi:O-antigen ligase